MRLGISAEFVRPGLVGGAEQALHYLVDGLIEELADGHRIVIIGDEFPVEQRSGVTFLDAPHRHSVRFVQESMTLRALSSELDVCYFPNYFTPPVRSVCPVITTIPDLKYRHYPENFSRKKRLWQRWAHGSTLRRADAVTVYSEFVRTDVLDHYGDRHAGKVNVLRLPVSWDRFGHDEAKRPARPYVLSVASHYKHKNLATLVRAFGAVYREHPDLELVLVGQLGGNLLGVSQADDIPAVVEEAGLGDAVRTTGYVGVQQLGTLYRNAELFVFPSVFEGFGLPPVEALGFGLPVVTTRCTSLPEVTRGLARYVDDPCDQEELAHTILEALRSSNRPAPDEIADLRAHYSPRAVARDFLAIARGLTRSA